MKPDHTIPADDRVNILLVDDQPAKLLSYEAMLGGMGENLVHATSARERSSSCSATMSPSC
jgi:CheY-like chemotaxis protein